MSVTYLAIRYLLEPAERPASPNVQSSSTLLRSIRPDLPDRHGEDGDQDVDVSASFQTYIRARRASFQSEKWRGPDINAGSCTYTLCTAARTCTTVVYCCRRRTEPWSKMTDDDGKERSGEDEMQEDQESTSSDSKQRKNEPLAKCCKCNKRHARRGT